MDTYLVSYVDTHGQHCEAVDGWDQELAVQSWYASHRGERCHLLSVVQSHVGEEQFA